MNQLCSSLEAILFASGDAIDISKLAYAAKVSEDEAEQALNELKYTYDNENRGIMLIRIGQKAQLCSRACYGDVVRRALENRKPPKLSPAALEVLTIIAYRQPVTRAYIDQLRGVDSSGTIANLIEKGFITEAGRLDVPGKPVLFRTTDVFLRIFCISSLSELPELPELAREEQLQLELSETE